MVQTQAGSLALHKMDSSQVSSNHSTGLQQQEGGALRTTVAGSITSITTTTTTGQPQRQRQMAGRMLALLLHLQEHLRL